MNDPNHNLLPFEGCVNYYGKIFDFQQSEKYFEQLFQEINWQNDSLTIFGKTIITARKVAWYGSNSQKYTYSKSTKFAEPFSDTLLKIKKIVEEISGESYNSCLLNLYHTGEEGMGWHSDNESEIQKESAIASVSFGMERTFSFKNKLTKQTIKINLENGSLLIMKGETQSHWLHALPKSSKTNGPRINLTFRKMIAE